MRKYIVVLSSEGDNVEFDEAWAKVGDAGELYVLAGKQHPLYRPEEPEWGQTLFIYSKSKWDAVWISPNQGKNQEELK